MNISVHLYPRKKSPVTPQKKILQRIDLEFVHRSHVSQKFRKLMMLQRRREQCRIAQQTVRNRKMYIQNLESRNKLLTAKYADLQASYLQSMGQVNALYIQCLETEKELHYWRCLAQSFVMPTPTTAAISATPMIEVHAAGIRQ